MRFFLVLYIGWITLGAHTAKAQMIPLNRWFTNEVNAAISGDSIISTAVKPLLLPIAQNKMQGSHPPILLNTWKQEKPAYQNFKERLLNGHLLEVQEKNVHLFADPVITVHGGKSNEVGPMTYMSSRGVNLQGLVGDKVSFGTSFLENQARFPLWLDSSIKTNNWVVPGEGKARPYRTTGFDYSRSDAFIGYTPSDHFGAVLGYGKNFIGDGYRSLLLSDNAFNYPYLRLNASFWRINYTVLYNQYTNVTNQMSERYPSKYATVHFLNISVGKRLQFGLFENVLWHARDTGGNRGFDLQYLNPVLFLRPVEFSVGSPDNSMFGFTAKYQLSNKTFLYGQAMLDDFNIGETKKYKQQHLNNKYGFQLGMWNKDLFKVGGLNHLIEYNTVRPYSYGHRKVDQNYTHYNQALAHPLGANFHEWVNSFYFTRSRWYGNFHSVVALKGEDQDEQNNGSDLWGGEKGAPVIGSTTLQGVRTGLYFTSLSFGYLVNPAMNMRLELQVGNRKKKNERSSQSESFLNIGLKTELGNTYFDF